MFLFLYVKFVACNGCKFLLAVYTDWNGMFEWASGFFATDPRHEKGSADDTRTGSGHLCVVGVRRKEGLLSIIGCDAKFVRSSCPPITTSRNVRGLCGHILNALHHLQGSMV